MARLDLQIDVKNIPEVKAELERLNARVEALRSELSDFHDHVIDQGHHDCEGIPGGCPVVNVLDGKVED